MTIRYLKNKDVDRKLWDGCIASALNPLVYAFSWYLDIICDEWDALVVGNYSAVFPLPLRRKYGISYLYQPPYAQQLGPVSCIQVSSFLADDFLYALPRKFRFAEIFLNTSSFPTKHQTIAYNNYVLDLSAKYSFLKQGYSENLLRNIKKGEAAGLQVVLHPDITLITELFSNNRGAGIENHNDPGYFRLRRLYHEAEHRGMARSWGVYNNANQLLAGALFMFDKERIVFLFSGLSDEGKEKGAMPLLLDHVIREFAGSAIKLDFEGSMDTGLARFYASFGSSMEHYWFFRMNRLPFPFKQIVKTLKNRGYGNCYMPG